MFDFNNLCSPLVVFEFEGPQTLEAHRQSLQCWNEQLARNELFVAIRIFRDDVSLAHPEGAAKLTRRWLRDGAGQRIKSRVLAMINVVPAAAYDRMKHLDVETVFGVPGGIFESTAQAVEWFNTVMGPGTHFWLRTTDTPSPGQIELLIGDGGRQDDPAGER